MRLTDTTPCLEEYAKFGTAQAVARHECVRKLAARIAGDYESLIDPLAGIGVDAQIFNAPDTRVNDRDEACRTVLAECFPAPTGYDFFDPEQRAALYARPADLIYLDFNNFTLAKWHKGIYRQELNDSFATARKYLILNDCSVFALRMWGNRKEGRGSYSAYSSILDVAISSPQEYLAALPRFFHRHYPEWYLTAHETFFLASGRGHGGTAYLLFSK